MSDSSRSGGSKTFGSRHPDSDSPTHPPHPHGHFAEHGLEDRLVVSLCPYALAAIAAGRQSLIVPVDLIRHHVGLNVGSDLLAFFDAHAQPGRLDERFGSLPTGQLAHLCLAGVALRDQLQGPFHGPPPSVYQIRGYPSSPGYSTATGPHFFIVSFGVGSHRKPGANLRN